METKQSKTWRFFSKNRWNTLIVLLSLIGIIFGFLGFTQLNYRDKLYETFRLFILNHQFEYPINNVYLEISRWSILIVFLLISFKLFFTIVAPKFFQYLRIRYHYDNHIIICGLTEESLLIANKYSGEQRVFIDNDVNNPLHRSIRAKNAVLIVGDPKSRTVLKSVRISHAKKVFVFTKNDVQNIEIAETIKKLSEKGCNKTITCYVNIDNLNYKRILNDAALFSELYPNFDGRLFNSEETGIRFGMLESVHKIFNSSKIHFLIAGLNSASICFLENFAHFFNPYDHKDKIKIAIVEGDKDKIDRFIAGHSFFEHFYDFEYKQKHILSLSKKELEGIEPSCCIVGDNPIQEIEIAMHLWKIFKNSNATILVLSKDLHKSPGISPIGERNIAFVNLFDIKYLFHEEFFQYIEELARKCHELYKETVKKNNPEKVISEYNELSEHFKDSNRHQAIDTYYKLLFIGALKHDELADFISIRTTLTLDEEKLLSRLEHRRWMIEKGLDGWTYGKEKNVAKKENPCFIPWDDLSEEEKKKDDNTIEIAKIILNKETKNVQA